MFGIRGLTGKSLFNLLCKGLYLLWAVSLVLILPGTEEAVLASGSSTVAANVTLSPLEVQVYAPHMVPVNSEFQINTVIKNHGDLPVTQATAMLTLPAQLKLVSGKMEVKLETIPQHGSKTSTWHVRALKKEEYSIAITGSGDYNHVIVSGKALFSIRILPGWMPRWFDDFDGLIEPFYK